jgi:hypothetical protein
LGAAGTWFLGTDCAYRGEGTVHDGFAFAVTGGRNLSKSNPAVASLSGNPADPGSWSGPLGRLHTLVVPSRIDPPVETRHQVLPFECLAWENFERFCLRLAIGRGEVVHSADHGGEVAADGRRSAREARDARDARDARLYGVRGQDQQGIDLYVRLAEVPDVPERRYLCLQSRRIARLTAAKLKKAVSDFLKGKWPPSCRVFVYATSLAAVRSELADEIRVQTERLRGEGIEFEVWDTELMSPWLKEKPSMVYDFFGRTWAESFCGPEAVDRLGTRLDAGQVGELRDQMHGQRRVRADIIAIALAGIYRDEAGTPQAETERVAAACLEQLPCPGDDYEATAESEIITAMGATRAARDRARARSMLARPQIPLATLAAGYARDPEALRPVLAAAACGLPFPASTATRLPVHAPARQHCRPPAGPRPYPAMGRRFRRPGGRRRVRRVPHPPPSRPRQRHPAARRMGRGAGGNPT